jgi:short-subunit dehydrogenase
MGMTSAKHARVIITGAGSGIGMELVKQFYPHTKHVLAVDISEKNLQALQAQFPDLEGFLMTDLSLKSGNQAILDWVSDHWDSLDFCFANAGKAAYQSAEKQDWKNMETLFQLNVFSPIQLGMELNALFPKKKFRHVITCSAMAFWSVPGYSLYGATKSSLLQWARTVWSEQSGDWLTLAFPIATTTGFFEAAGNQIPKAFPRQNPETVATKMIEGALAGKKRIFPSSLFRIMLILNNFLPVILPLYERLEYLKLKAWLSKQT